MSVELRIPTSGESITEVQIGEWRKAIGDRVEVDEVLVEVETDKAAMDLPSPVNGILTEILKGDGEEVGVGDVIALIDESADGAGAPVSKPAKKQATKAADSKPQASKAPAKAKQPATSPELPKSESKVMPAARRALAEQGLAPEDVEATGPGGRLLKEDVERQAETTAPKPAKPAAATPQAPKPKPPAGPSSEREEQVVGMSPMRRVIAKRLVEAQQNAALLTTFNEVDMSTVIALRKKHQEAFRAKHDIKLGFMSFFVKAVVEALKRFPAVNAEVRDTDIVYKNYFDIGIAVGGGKGLVVPVLRGVERMSFSEIELVIADFARRAQVNQLELSELQGGTFTISNGGVYGSMLSTPIVNAPQSGILGLHAIQDRPAAVEGEVVVRPMMYVALTYDHRIVDGREAVGFLRHIKEVIEDPLRILIEI